MMDALMGLWTEADSRCVGTEPLCRRPENTLLCLPRVFAVANHALRLLLTEYTSIYILVASRLQSSCLLLIYRCANAKEQIEADWQGVWVTTPSVYEYPPTQTLPLQDQVSCQSFYIAHLVKQDSTEP
jgi:hypothetical protein